MLKYPLRLKVDGDEVHFEDFNLYNNEQVLKFYRMVIGSENEMRNYVKLLSKRFWIAMKIRIIMLI